MHENSWNRVFPTVSVCPLSRIWHTNSILKYFDIQFVRAKRNMAKCSTTICEWWRNVGKITVTKFESEIFTIQMFLASTERIRKKSQISFFGIFFAVFWRGTIYEHLALGRLRFSSTTQAHTDSKDKTCLINLFVNIIIMKQQNAVHLSEREKALKGERQNKILAASE